MIVAGERRISNDEHEDRARRLATTLAETNATRVAIALKNRPEFFEALDACALVGAEIVPLAWRLAEDEYRYIVDDSGVDVVIAEPGAPHTKAHTIPVGTGYADVPLDGRAEPARFRFYTSGTTGRPKAVERERRREAAEYTEAILNYPPLEGVTGPDEVHLVCGPLYHTGPLAFANYARVLGQDLVIMDRFDATECLNLIERERVTWSHMVPINFVRILAVPHGQDLSSVKKILHAAAPCPPHIKHRIMSVFPPNTVWEYYGMTEGFGTLIGPDEWLKHPGSVGKAGEGVTVIGENGSECKPNEVGIVYVLPTGGIRFSYAGAPDKTAEAWLGDRFTVGDMGYVDEDGYLFLTDRRQDMIISGGANVYPAEVEAVIMRHHAVRDCAVIGIPDDEYGERVLAIVEIMEPITAQHLIDFCRDNLAHYKCPGEVKFVDELPRSESGKVRKRELREPYWAGRKARI